MNSNLDGKKAKYSCNLFCIKSTNPFLFGVSSFFLLVESIIYLWPCVTLYISFVTERKESKGSLTNSDEIVIADTAHITNGTSGIGAAATTTATVTTVPPKVTTVYEENEKTGETTDVSDKSQ